MTFSDLDLDFDFPPDSMVVESELIDPLDPTDIDDFFGIPVYVTPNAANFTSTACATQRKLIYTGPSPYSGHAIDGFLKCPQYWVLKYGIKDLTWQNEAESDTSPALVMGTMGHQGLGLYYRRMQAVQEGQNPEEWATPIEGVRALACKGGLYLSSLSTVIEGIKQYLTRYEHNEAFTVLGVDGDGASMLIGEIDGVDIDGVTPVKFKISRGADIVVQSKRDGKIYVFDHKWVGNIKPQTLLRYAGDGQFLDYQWIGKQIWGEKFGGVILNLAAWPNNNGVVKFYRNSIGTAPFGVATRVANLRYELEHRARLLVRRGRLNIIHWPKKQTEHVCQGPYRMCAAFEVCTQGTTAKMEYNEEKMNDWLGRS